MRISPLPRELECVMMIHSIPDYLNTTVFFMPDASYKGNIVKAANLASLETFEVLVQAVCHNSLG